jgi:hypothetical protein
MDARGVIERVLLAVDRLDLLAPVPIWTLDGPGVTREARLAPAIGAALPPEPYGYDPYEPSFFEAFGGADAKAIARAIEASFDVLAMLPPDTPQLGSEADDEGVVTVRLGSPIQIASTSFLWLSRRAVDEPGRWVEERYWVQIDERGAPIASSRRFGEIEPWSQKAWRRE